MGERKAEGRGKVNEVCVCWETEKERESLCCNYSRGRRSLATLILGLGGGKFIQATFDHIGNGIEIIRALLACKSRPPVRNSTVSSLS